MYIGSTAVVQRDRAHNWSEDTTTIIRSIQNVNGVGTRFANKPVGWVLGWLVARDMYSAFAKKAVLVVKLFWLHGFV